MSISEIPTSRLRLIVSVSSAFGSCDASPRVFSLGIHFKHHRHGHLYSYLTLQLDHHRQLYEVVKVYQFVQWPVKNCRRSLLCIPRPTGNGGLAYIGGYLCVRFECEEQRDIFWLIGGEFQDGKDLNNKYDDCVFN
ncbi:hypothetical protein F2Q69_00020164 [Brassica cretica]|uniref:Uncharacterized protein n=1 Tax=Brassica cretica TaxID=69181 RepID=A0A8S9QIQ0_BRACR|nr:hypothetical protein F2Q69_00020164 [Brassica cretica]